MQEVRQVQRVCPTRRNPWIDTCVCDVRATRVEACDAESQRESQLRLGLNDSLVRAQ